MRRVIRMDDKEAFGVSHSLRLDRGRDAGRRGPEERGGRSEGFDFGPEGLFRGDGFRALFLDDVCVGNGIGKGWGEDERVVGYGRREGDAICNFRV